RRTHLLRTRRAPSWAARTTQSGAGAARPEASVGTLDLPTLTDVIASSAGVAKRGPHLCVRVPGGPAVCAARIGCAQIGGFASPPCGGFALAVDAVKPESSRRSTCRQLEAFAFGDTARRRSPRLDLGRRV